MYVRHDSVPDRRLPRKLPHDSYGLVSSDIGYLLQHPSRDLFIDASPIRSAFIVTSG
jgi:hypothetical protein